MFVWKDEKNEKDAGDGPFLKIVGEFVRKRCKCWTLFRSSKICRPFCTNGDWIKRTLLCWGNKQPVWPEVGMKSSQIKLFPKVGIKVAAQDL